MQGCSYLLENHGEHHNIMVTIQLLIIVNASKIYKNGSKWYSAFIEFPFAKFLHLDAANSFFLRRHKLNSTVFHLYVTFHHTVAQKYLHCNAMIFVYRVFSRLHLITKFLKFSVSERK